MRPMNGQPLSLDQRRVILQKEINGYLNKGFRVQSQSETTAQLIKPKKFSFLWAILWFFVFGVGLILYLLYYLSKKDQAVYLEVSEAGQVKRNGVGGLTSGGLRLVGLSGTGMLILCGGCLGVSIIAGLFDDGNQSTQIQSGNITSTIVATNSEPTETPTPISTSTPPPIIIDFSEVLNSSSSEVKKYLGVTTEALTIKPGEFPEFPDGGVSRTYYVDDFTIYVLYDNQNIAREMFMSGLEKYGYAMDEWQTLMLRLGFPIDREPNRVAQAGRHWDNYKGYGVSLQASSINGPIDFAKIFKLP